MKERVGVEVDQRPKFGDVSERGRKCQNLAWEETGR